MLANIIGSLKQNSIRVYWVLMSCAVFICAIIALDEFDQNRRAEQIRAQRKAALHDYFQTGSYARILELYRKYLATYNADPDDPVNAFAVITTRGAMLQTGALAELSVAEFPDYIELERTMLKGRSDQLRILRLAWPYGNDSKFDWSTFRYLEQRYPRDSYLYAMAAHALSKKEEERDFDQILAWSRRSVDLEPLNPNRHVFYLRHLVQAAQNSGEEKDWIAADSQLARLRAIKDKDFNRNSQISHEVYALDKHFQRLMPSSISMDWNSMW